MDEFGSVLEELRKKTRDAVASGRLSYARLAVELGVTESAAWRYVYGQRKRISWDVMARWAAFMGVQLPGEKPAQLSYYEANRIADKIVARLGDLIAQAIREAVLEALEGSPDRSGQQRRDR